MADALLALVLAGTKTATCWAADSKPPTVVGQRQIVLDGRGRPAALLETVAIEQRRFDAVDAAFAHAEGEGDRSLANWRAEHRAFFTRHGAFQPDMPLWCERFRLVDRL